MNCITGFFMKKYDVVGLGNAIVDVIAKVEDSYLEKHELNKGSMALIDEAQAETLYDDMPPAVESSGGSAANTLAGISSFGGAGAFIGKVKDDELGRIFAHDLKAIGVHYQTKPAKDGASTARCLIAVTADAERTMSTFLGATRGITTGDIEENLIKDSKILYLEGYLWDEQHAKNAMRKAVELAKQYDCKVALSLSDPFCVNRHRAEFLQLIEEGVDIVFANEEEIKGLFETDDFDIAAANAKNIAEIVAITRGAKGSVIVNGDKQEKISVPSGLNVVDTTGAGDLYASGFLYGYTNGNSLAECGRLATVAASEIVGHMGARPEVNLADLAKKAA